MSRSLAGDTSDDLQEEDIHDVLSNRRRRLVLDLVQEHQTISVRELSERIGAIESGEDPPPRNVKQSVYVSLLQTHLPKLDELGVVDYEPEGKLVSVDGGLDEVTVYLEAVPKYGLSWAEYYAGVALLGLLTVVAAEVGTPVVAAVPAVYWAYAFFLLLFGSGLYHSARQGRTILQRLRA